MKFGLELTAASLRWADLLVDVQTFINRLDKSHGAAFIDRCLCASRVLESVRAQFLLRLEVHEAAQQGVWRPTDEQSTPDLDSIASRSMPSLIACSSSLWH